MSIRFASKAVTMLLSLTPSLWKFSPHDCNPVKRITIFLCNIYTQHVRSTRITELITINLLFTSTDSLGPTPNLLNSLSAVGSVSLSRNPRTFLSKQETNTLTASSLTFPRHQINIDNNDGFTWTCLFCGLDSGPKDCRKPRGERQRTRLFRQYPAHACRYS